MGQLLGEALDSVGAQSYPNWEIIVVDDAGPEDGTRQAVETFAAKHPRHRVEYIRHETNKGVSMARRTALEAARGDYIAFLDADDAYLPEKLTRAMECFAANPNCILVHSGAVGIGTNPSFSGGPEEWFRFGDASRCYNARTESNLMRTDHICNSTVVVARSALKPEDFATQMLYQFEDWFLWLQLSRRGLFFYQHERLTKYRMHPDSFMFSAKWERGVRDFGKIELMLALFPYLDARRERREAAEAIVEKLQLILSSRTARGGRISSRWGLKLRWALLKALIFSDLRKFAAMFNSSRG